MISKERVKRAIEFRGPDRIPIFADADTDIVRLSYVDPTGWVPRYRLRGDFQDEWGCLWYSSDATMGHVKRSVLADIHAADQYVFPDPHLAGRWQQFDAQIEENRDRYIVGNAQYLCFDRLTFLLGEEAALEAMLSSASELGRLMDRIIDFEIAIVDELAERGVDGIRFWDDVGAGHGVIMGPDLWRALFKPRYERIFEHIRNRGLHVHWHSCGDCLDIMEELVAIGVDVFSIGEPFMMGVDELAKRFAGRVCFECSPDNRKILSHGDRQQIEEAVGKLVSAFGLRSGGLIMVAAKDNFDCVSPEAQEMATEAVQTAARSDAAVGEGGE